MENLVNFGRNGINDSTKVCNFLQGIRSIALEAAVNAV